MERISTVLLDRTVWKITEQSQANAKKEEEKVERTEDKLVFRQPQDERFKSVVMPDKSSEIRSLPPRVALTSPSTESSPEIIPEVYQGLLSYCPNLESKEHYILVNDMGGQEKYPVLQHMFRCQGSFIVMVVDISKYRINNTQNPEDESSFVKTIGQWLSSS